jgi:hypothetical protein
VTRSPLTEAAGDYLSRGLAVIALTGKTPNVQKHRRGLYDALRGEPETEADWEFIESFMDHRATTGIGILTGEPYVVVDIDGEEGAIQWRDLAGDAHMPDRWVAKTGRGLHLWFAPSTDLLVPSGEGFVGPGTLKLGPKLDLKGYGGYVAAPPSAHPDGHTYEWLLPPGEDPPIEAPEPLLKEVRDHLFDLKQAMAAKAIRNKAWGPKYKPGDHVYYAQPGHDSLIKGMKEAQEGNRNAYLHWAAATLSEEGGQEEDFEALFAAATANGLLKEESIRTIKSARRGHG